MTDRYVLNFLLVEGEDGWWARCLEYDFVTQADTLKDLYYEIERTVAGHVMISAQEGTEPFKGLRRAPAQYWQMFRDSHLILRPRDFTLHAIPGVLSADIPTPELQELRVAEVT